MAILRQRLLFSKQKELISSQTSTTKEALISFGFSDSMISQFFQPFLGGIFLESALETSSAEG